MSLIVVIGSAFIFYLEGIGLASWILKKYAISSKNIEVSLSISFGLAFNTFLFSNVYYLLPFFSISQLAIALNAVLMMISIGLLIKTGRMPSRPSRIEISTLTLSLFATGLILRPLLHLGGLGFYFSNNGEFQHYAVLADALKFNTANFEIGGPFGLHSRESYTSLFIAQLSSITGVPTLWLTQPVAGTFALVFFTSFAALVHVLVPRVIGRTKRLFVYMLLTSFMLNATSQLFFSLSFVSQYLAMALFVGVFLLLSIGVPLHSKRGIIANILIGVLCGNVLLVYPEMYPINLFLILLYVVLLYLNKKSSTISDLLKTLLLIILIGFGSNIEGARSFFSRSLPSSGGWNIFGDLSEFETFSGNLFGLSNPFFGPPKPYALLLLCLVVIGFASFLGQNRGNETWTPIRSWRALLLSIAIIAIAIYFYIHKFELGTNYMLLKFILGSTWIGYLVLILGFANRTRIGVSLWVALLLLLGGQAQVGYSFSKHFTEDSKLSIFSLKDATQFQEFNIDPNSIYLPNVSPYVIPGKFFIYKEDLSRDKGAWGGSEYSTDKLVLVLGKRLKVSDDPLLINNYQTQKENNSFNLLEPK